MAKELKEKTNGKVQLLRHKSLKECALNFWLDLIAKYNITFEGMDKLEQHFLHEAYQCGITHYYKEDDFEGDVTTIDLNSSYPFIFLQMFFPFRKPEFKTLKMSDLNIYQNMYSFKYGVYRAEVEYDETKRKQFKWKTNNYYTNTDLMRAQTLGLEVKLIEDGEVNAMIYDQEKLIKGEKLFSEYINLFYDLKKQGVNGAKDFLNILTGALSKRVRHYVYPTEEKELDLEGKDLINLSNEHGRLKVEYTDKKIFFKYPFARITIFAVAKLKAHLQKQIDKCVENVVYSNTDSICINADKEFIKKTFNIGSELGQFKIEYNHCGHLKIENKRLILNNGEWNKPKV